MVNKRYTGPGPIPYETHQAVSPSDFMKRVWSELEKMGAAIEATVGEIERVSENHTIRIDRLQDRLHRDGTGERFEVWTDRQLEKIAATLSEVRSAVFSESGDNRIIESHHRITEETARINYLRKTMIDRVSKLEMAITDARLGIVEDFDPGSIPVDPEETFSAPIGGQNRGDKDWAVWSNKSQNTDDAMAAGLTLAQERARNYMAGHFSNATINGVCDAIRNG